MDSDFSEGKVPDRPSGNTLPFAHRGDRPPSDRAATPIEEMFWANEGRIIHKWHHYLPLYERYLSPWRDRPVRMLEIGVNKGGSLQLWRRYLGPQAVLFGIDIDESCAQFDGQSAQVRIGSQADPEFLCAVVAEMGGIDVVLDDGSHHSEHIRASLDTLFPLLSEGGTYLIEDLHASYWTNFGGGYRKPGAFIEVVKAMIDDMHHWYHGQGETVAATAGHLAAVHVYDSVVALEKQRVLPPLHSKRGQK